MRATVPRDPISSLNPATCYIYSHLFNYSKRFGSDHEISRKVTKKVKNKKNHILPKPSSWIYRKSYNLENEQQTLNLCAVPTATFYYHLFPKKIRKRKHYFHCPICCGNSVLYSNNGWQVLGEQERPGDAIDVDFTNLPLTKMLIGAKLY